MTEQAKAAPPAQAAAEAVKAYIRMNRGKLAADGELLALLLPERADIGEVRDFQRFVIDKLSAEIATLKAERDGLLGAQSSSVRMGEGVRRFVLDLIDARSFAEAIAVVIAAAPSFGADRAAICVEGDGGVARTRTEGVRLIPVGTTEAVLGRDGTGAILSGGGELLLGAGGAEFRSLAAFRVKIGREAPAALFVLGAVAEHAFEDEGKATDLRFAARALERAIRAWLDLPKI
ncbi:MAG TPA: hypothetical protein VNU97_16765 [Rhizomicrobium sp.]|jgi:uncharacterized protein YigA (DUF484 family)|nr:hypothetical protein [Rhizomicrobium sp.]